MSEFSEQYFRDLAPRERRFDTPIADQLAFCVFPNGVKSWVYLYEVDGFTRRRTIGLFPDMSYEEALRSLDPNRRIAQVDAEEQRRGPERPATPKRLTEILNRASFLKRVSMRDLLTGGGTAVAALTVFILLGRTNEPAAVREPTPPASSNATVAASTEKPAAAGTAETTPAPSRPTAASGEIRRVPVQSPDPDPPPQSIESVDAAGPTATGTAPDTQTAGAAEQSIPDELPAGTPSTETVNGDPLDASAEATGDDPTLQAIEDAAEETASPPDSGLAETTADDPLEPSAVTAGENPIVEITGDAGAEDDAEPADSLPSDSDDVPTQATDAEGDQAPDPAANTETPAAADATVAEAATEPAEAEAPSTEAASEPATSEPASSEPASSEPATSEPAVGSPDEPTAAIVAVPAENASDSPADAAAIIASSAPDYIERAVLTDNVVDGEPQETLSRPVFVAADSDRSIYFFTELEESAGQIVLHRWLLNGAVAFELQLEAGDDLRVYSDTRLGSDQAGSWRVEALTPDGQLLASANFMVETGAPAETEPMPDSEPETAPAE